MSLKVYAIIYYFGFK